MKYIDAEKLKDEIKHLKIDVYDEAHQFDLGARSSLTFLESFIDSLQQEQPEVDLEKAARHLYESWMGGTMDEVRRDMGELGKVLNARKEDKK